MAARICIQGYEGSFHQQAARNVFGPDVEVIPCATFRELIRLAGDPQQSEGGVMAIENSIAGSILPNYGLLQRSNLKVTGEVYLQINQHLMANPGVELSDIREVHSHPMALQQCLEFLDGHHWKLVETEDTALSARHVHRHRSRHIAAVASSLAAEIYDLNILAENIQSEKNNITRFLVLEREERPLDGANKASVNFNTLHEKGSLARVLTVLAEEGVNLSKLQSFPVPGSDWQYSFHADLEFEEPGQLTGALKIIKPLTQALRVYGIYRKGNTIHQPSKKES